MPLWRSRELAIVQGVSYPNPNLSHFRSIEIWDTLRVRRSTSRTAGSPARLPRRRCKRFAADGVVVGKRAGPFAGSGAARSLPYRAVPPGEARAADPG
jgi:uncharacterized protein (DUF1501 family)